MTERGDNQPPFRVSHVVFDIDGTLIDFVGAHEAGMAAAAAKASEVSRNLVTPDAIRSAQRVAAAELRATGMPILVARNEGFRRALAAVGCAHSDIDVAVDAYNAAREVGLEPYPDVEPTVVALVQRGFVLVAASNGNAEMAQHEVFRHFTSTWFAQEAGVAKPDPRFFLGALGSVGAMPEVAVMVGDRLENDYEPARSIGMSAVLIDREGRIEAGAATRITVLTDLLALLERP